MDRSIQKNGLVNLALALAIFIAGFAVTVFAASLAGQAASVFLGLGVLVTFVSWFQMRLEENERLEKLEMDELARSRGASLFEAKDSGSFPARNLRPISCPVLWSCCCCWKPPARSGCGIGPAKTR